MKFLVFSDSHGIGYRMREAVLRHPDADCCLHLGDGNREFVRLCDEMKIHGEGVQGNCDSEAAFDRPPESLCLTLGGCPVFLCHGHRYSVKYGTDALVRAGVERGARLILFGHTHQPLEQYLPDEGESGVYLLNPGSIAYTHSYGIVTVQNGQLLTSIGEI